MNRYNNGKIYKIVDKGLNKCYIGCTCEDLEVRLTRHKCAYNFYKKGKQRKITSFDLFDEYGIENCKIELIEYYPCNSKEELLSREGFYVQQTVCVNRPYSGLTRNEYSKKYYQENKEEQSKKNRQWRDDNHERYKETSKKWRQDNKDYKRQKDKEYQEQNKDKIQKQRQQHYLMNKERIKERVNKYAVQIHNCECGASFRKDNLSKHRKTKTHLDFMNSLITTHGA